jgi:hypothetical protein
MLRALLETTARANGAKTPAAQTDPQVFKKSRRLIVAIIIESLTRTSGGVCCPSYSKVPGHAKVPSGLGTDRIFSGPA